MSNEDEKFHFYGTKTFKNHKGVNELRRVSLSGLQNKSDIISIGMAACSLSEQFKRKKGRGISLHRAKHIPHHQLKLIELDKSKVETLPRKQFIEWCKNYCD